MERHGYLIDQLRGAVSKEFYSLIVESHDYSIDSKIGSGSNHTEYTSPSPPYPSFQGIAARCTEVFAEEESWRSKRW